MSVLTDETTPDSTVRVATGGNGWSWAAYLGASWTWCIGMFLPVLLVRDYGPWAWVIFAVPNIVGAGAMGWVMRSQSMSRQYTVDHASACRLFSFVTIAFQLFFSLWMLPRLVGPVGYIGAAVIVQSAFTPFTNTRWLRLGGAAVLVVSVTAFIGINAEHPVRWPGNQAFSLGDAAGLSLVCLAGFLACPYLDLTFHRARQMTSDRDAKVAFGVGFGVLFAAMIVLTFFYAADVRRLGLNSSTVLNRAAMAFLALHWLIQMTYTVHVHAAELCRQATARDDAGDMRSGLGLWLGVGLAIGLAAHYAGENDIAALRFSSGETGYRVFMSAYGLLFPAYVFLAVRRPQVSLIAWLTLSAFAAPFYWLAFLQGRMVWAVVGVAVLVAGSVVVRAFTPPAPAPPIE